MNLIVMNADILELFYYQIVIDEKVKSIYAIDKLDKKMLNLINLIKKINFINLDLSEKS